MINLSAVLSTIQCREHFGSTPKPTPPLPLEKFIRNNVYLCKTFGQNRFPFSGQKKAAQYYLKCCTVFFFRNRFSRVTSLLSQHWVWSFRRLVVTARGDGDTTKTNFTNITIANLTAERRRHLERRDSLKIELECSIILDFGSLKLWNNIMKCQLTLCIKNHDFDSNGFRWRDWRHLIIKVFRIGNLTCG